MAANSGNAGPGHAGPSSANPGREIGSAVVAAVFILVGAIAFYDTTHYVDIDSAVFPRTVAVALIVFSLIYLIGWLLGRTPPAEEHAEGSWLRRIALVLIMLGAALAMPWIGFVISALVSFGALILAAMYDPWTRFRIVVYPLVGIAIVVGFYMLFAKVLHVPLPVGRLFNL